MQKPESVHTVTTAAAANLPPLEAPHKKKPKAKAKKGKRREATTIVNDKAKTKAKKKANQAREHDEEYKEDT